MKEKYISVTGFNYYCGKGPFKIGNLIRCEKEPSNPHDNEAIKCTMPMIGTVGYVANSTGTVAGGTMSAGRIYDKVNKKFYARIMFTTGSKVICRVEDGEPEELKNELLAQLDDGWDDDDDDDLLCDDDDFDEYEDQ